MSDDALITHTRIASLQVVRGHLNAAYVERAAIDGVAGEGLADRTWHAARGVAESARREVNRALRERFGPRDPHRGWLGWLLFFTLLAAAFALVTALGVQRIPTDTGVSGWLGLAVAAMDLLLLAVARTRTLNRAFPRALAPTPVLLAVTTVALVNGDLPGVEGALAGAVVSFATLVWVVAVRHRDAEARHEIDMAIPMAYLNAAPLLREGVERIQNDVLAELGSDRAAQVVRVRDAVLAELATDHPKLRDAPTGVPAGALIIGHLTENWSPVYIPEGSDG